MQTFAYYGWNVQGGRLQSILAGVTDDLDSVQNLEYSYDAGGNVDWIKDWKAGAPQLQDFTYDALSRLTGATVTGGSEGLYSESYGYDDVTGNLVTKGILTLNYTDNAHKHAVKSAGGNTYSYDANGNMTQRVIGTDTYQLLYDAENRMVEVTKNSVTVATFVYDGDGQRVQSNIGDVTTTFVGNYYEVSGSTVTKYYYAGASRVAMNVSGMVSYLLTDQLGSTSITTDSGGAKIAELRYDAWGSIRYSNGATPTKYTYTGQYSNVSDFGLMFYNARWYDSSLGRFTSADTVVPGGVQGYDRYAYANNNPVVYNDPSGHVSCTSGNWDDGPQCRYRDSMLKGGYRSITVGARTGGGRPDLGTTAEESYADNSSGPQQTTIDPVTGKTYESPAEDRSVAGGIGNALAAAEDLAKSMDKTLSPVNLYGRLQYYESADGSVSLKSVFVINASDDYVRLKRMQVTGGGQSYDVNPQLITSPNADVYGLGAGTSKSIALTLSGNPANPANSFGNGSGSVGLNLIWRTKTEQKWSWMTFSIR